MDDLKAELERHPFLHGMRPEHRARLLPLAQRVEFPAGHVLFAEGDERHEFFLLIDGRVSLELVTHGEVLNVEALGPGSALGWSAVMLGRGKGFQARALDPVTALVFPGLEVLEVCRRDKDFGFELMQRLMAVVSRRLQAARLKVLDSYWSVAKRAGA